jgi:hypothetical protein
MDADGYVIIDTTTGTFWENAKGKRIWNTKGAAVRAYGVGHEYNKDIPKYSDQTVFVVRPVRFIDMETGHYFT